MEIEMNNKNGTEIETYPAISQQSDQRLQDAIAHHMVASLAPNNAKSMQEPAGDASFADFASSLDGFIASNSELRSAVEASMVRSARQALAASDAVVPSAADMTDFLRSRALQPRGGTVVRPFWWGFNIQISHETLTSFLAGASAVNDIAEQIGQNAPSAARPWILLAAAFVAGALALLRALDRGRGVYISMSWFAPGVFVPTSV
jgi:hypothetical protein